MALLPPDTGAQEREPADVNEVAAIVRTTPFSFTRMSPVPVVELLHDMVGADARHDASQI